MTDIGDVKRLEATFRDEAGALADPTTVVLKVKAPSGTTTTYNYPTPPTITKVSTGLYRYDLTITLAGLYTYRWETTGTPTLAEQGDFYVQPSNV